MEDELSTANLAPAKPLDDIGVVATIPALTASLVPSLDGLGYPLEDAGVVWEQRRVVALDRGSRFSLFAIPDEMGLILADDGTAAQ